MTGFPTNNNQNNDQNNDLNSTTPLSGPAQPQQLQPEETSTSRTSLGIFQSLGAFFNSASNYLLRNAIILFPQQQGGTTGPEATVSTANSSGRFVDESSSIERALKEWVNRSGFGAWYYSSDESSNRENRQIAADRIMDFYKGILRSYEMGTPGPSSLDLIALHLDTLPKEIGKLMGLESLDISLNNFEAIPREILSLQSLRILKLHHGMLERIPNDIENLGNLKELSLFGNNLSELPSKIGNLSELSELNLGRNRLVTIPREIGKLQNLKTLILDENKLVSLPYEIGDLEHLRVLGIKHNSTLLLLPLSLERRKLNIELSGTFPGKGVCFPSEDVMISTNHDSLSLVNGLRTWVESGGEASNQRNRETAALRILIAYNNAVKRRSEEAPAGALGGVDDVRATKLNLKNLELDSLPHVIVSLAELNALDISGNEFTTFPPEIVSLPELKELNIRGNKFTTLPKEISKLVNLKKLDL